MKKTNKKYTYHESEGQCVVDYGLFKPREKQRRESLLDMLPIAAEIEIPKTSELEKHKLDSPELVIKIQHLIEKLNGCEHCNDKDDLILFFLGYFQVSMSDWPDNSCNFLCKRCLQKRRLGENVIIRKLNEN